MDRKTGELMSIITAAIVATGAVVVHSSGPVSFPELQMWILIGFAAAVAFSGPILRAAGFKGDHYIWRMALFLFGLGYVEIYRLRPDLVIRQGIWLLAGVITALVLSSSRWSLKFIERYKYILGVVIILLFIVTIAFGTEQGGSRSWLSFGDIGFQPSEISKLLLILFLASYLSEVRPLLSIPTRKIAGRPVADPAYLAPLAVMCGLFLFLLGLQKDLGAALIYFSVSVCMLYAAGAQRGYLLLSAVFLMIGAVVLYNMFGHVRIRFDVWLNPWADPDGKGYQIIQSLFALASGGVVGTGLGAGQPSAVPVVETDFIFSSIGEELGLLGTIGLILAYLMFLFRIFFIALRARTDFEKLLVTGLGSLLGMQTFIIMAGVCKLLPLTGVTLPFVSYGGSSLVTSFALIGLVMKVSSPGANDEHVRNMEGSSS